jgi:tripartite-type tricarboxylate transporter receptor subunit TctC
MLGALLAAARVQPGRISAGLAGNGSAPHLALELLRGLTCPAAASGRR